MVAIAMKNQSSRATLAAPLLLQKFVRSMVRRQAIRMAVVGQDANHITFPNGANLALPNHPLQLTSQRCQARNSRFHRLQLLLGDCIGSCTGLRGVIRQPQQLPYRFKGKPQLSGMPDKGQALCVSRRVNTLIPLISVRGGH
jgi:hypothetical protein